LPFQYESEADEAGLTGGASGVFGVVAGNSDSDCGMSILKRCRPELRIAGFSAPPTEIVLVTNLDPTSRVLFSRYAEAVESVRTPPAPADYEAYLLRRSLKVSRMLPGATGFSQAGVGVGRTRAEGGSLLWAAPRNLLRFLDVAGTVCKSRGGRPGVTVSGAISHLR
jgi:hypothetical protein